MSNYHKDYYQKNKKEIQEKRHAYYVKNREKLCEAERIKRRDLAQNNPEAYQQLLQKQRDRAAKRRKSGKERERQREWESKNRDKIRKGTNTRRQKQRIKTIRAYGGKCECCSETKLEFLCMDHVNGGGAKHRRELSPADRREFYRWLEQQGYPDEFRVLCHNCNMSLGLYGFCPHQSKPLDDT